MLGLGTDEFFAASDPLAIAQHTNDFVFLEDGDVAELTANTYKVFDANQNAVEREVTHIDITNQAMSKGDHKHYMEKEIYEQPEAVMNTINGRIGGDDVLDNIFGLGSSDLFAKVQRIQIVACGTSLHAGRVAANWLSAIADLPCQVDYASEYRYRNPHVDKNSLLITISQSGETADTLAALSYAKDNVRSISAASWVVKAFVEATPISGPALVNITKSDSLARELVGTLQIPTLPR